VLRQTVIALRIADVLGFDAAQRSSLYHSSLLVNVACHTEAHEQAKWFGDDIRLKETKYSHGLRGPKAAVAGMKVMGGIGRPLLQRFRIGVEFAMYGRKEVANMVDGHAALAKAFAKELGMDDDVQAAVASSYEQWDGKGWPGDLKGEAIPLAARISQLAEFVEAAYRAGGAEAATAMARKQLGKQFDPALVDLLCTNADAILQGLQDINVWATVIDNEPSLSRPLTEDEFDRALEAVANFVDLKSPYTLGHSAAVSELAHDAAVHRNMSAEDARMLRRAALVSGFGRLGVSNAIWDKPGSLGTGNGNAFGSTRISRNACSASHPNWRSCRRSQCSTASDSTDRATPRAQPAARSHDRRGCSPPPTCTSRCANHDRFAKPAPPMTRPRNCGPK
jgi:hypothetical protein